MLTRFVMFIMHLYYKNAGMTIYYIKGTGKDYPKYLLYTEDVNAYKRMDRFCD